MLLRHKL